MVGRSVFSMVLPIQYKNLLFFISKGVVICNVVQMRPRTWVRIQNPAVPDSPQLSNTSARTPPHTNTHARTRAHHEHRCTPHLGQLWRQRSPWLPDARLLRQGGLGGRVRGPAARIPAAGHNHLQSRPPAPARLPVAEWAG